MPAPSRYLHLELRPAQPLVLERIARRHPDVMVSPRLIVVPLEHYRPEEVMAECRRYGLQILASRVKRSSEL